MDNSIVLSIEEVNAVINAIKKIKPNGFKSTNKIVALVRFFENKVLQTTGDMNEADSFSKGE